MCISQRQERIGAEVSQPCRRNLHSLIFFLVSYEGDGLQASQGFFFCQSFCVSSHLSCDCVFFLALQCFSDEPDNRGDVGLMCSRRQQMWRISFLSRVVCKMLRRTAGYRITSFFCFLFEDCKNNLMQPVFDSCCRDWITELRWVFLECKHVESKATLFCLI